jgi:CRP-like cAMP-binding protein
LRPCDYHAGQVLHAGAEMVGKVVFLQSGAAALLTELADGQTIQFAMVGRDSLVGGGAALGVSEATYLAVVQTRGKGHELAADVARQIARESPDFQVAVIRHEQVILAQAQQTAACNATHNLEQRIAAWLLRLCDATGDGSLEVTQEFLAQMLGVRRTSVSLMANLLQKSGLIRYRRGRVSVDNPELLRQRACECYRTIRQRYDRLAETRSPTTVP